METVTIVRRGQLGKEYDVEIFKPSWGRLKYVNPAQQVTAVTGVHIGRNHCIISMAWGFKDAGHSVIIEHIRRKGCRRLRVFEPPSYGVPIYRFFGAVYIRNEWETLAYQLLKLYPPHRHEVLERTAEFYWSLGSYPRGLHLIL
jgi:hypothetical protein